MSTPFALVQAALAGARIPLEHGGVKLLHFMLERPEGCDATITPQAFYIQYGWHLAHHPYTHELAPGVVSWLCEAAPTGYLPAGTLPWWFEHGAASGRWAYGSRRIWFAPSPDRVVVMVRDATVDPGAAALPPPIEPPIEYLAGDHPCPHCGAVPERYRRLRDGSLVCLACGRSST